MTRDWNDQLCDYRVGAEATRSQSRPGGQDEELEVEVNPVANDSISCAYVIKCQ